MAWIDQRNPLSTAAYRYIHFVGGRILQSNELNALQDAQKQKDQYTEDALFREGAVLNAGITVAGLNVTLAAADGSKPILVMINGAWEPLAPGVYVLPALKTGGTDTLYLHWALWRVTKDGTYTSGGVTSGGCLIDPALTDTVTGEAVAERGQMQMILSFDAALSSEPIDAVREIAKSITGIPVFRFTWTNNVAAYTQLDNFSPSVVATPASCGVVKLTTATSGGLAVANDDPRLTTPPLVSTPGVAVLETDGNTTAIDSPEVYTDGLGAHGGIDAALIYLASLKARVSDVLSWLYTQVSTAVAELVNHENRIAALENKPAQSVDLSYHIGQPLSHNSSGAATHPPIVNDTGDGYRHLGVRVEVLNQPNDEAVAGSKVAYGAFTQKGVLLGYIAQSGDFVLANPALTLRFTGMPDGQNGLRYSNFVTNVFSRLQQLEMDMQTNGIAALQSQIDHIVTVLNQHGFNV